ASAALDRVQQEVERNRAEGLPDERSQGVVPSIVTKVRMGRGDDGDPIFRNGVPYYNGWTIRAGTSRLRLPAYEGWQRVSPSNDFYKMQLQSGELGEHLASVTYNEDFMRSMRTKYVSFLSLAWVPQ